MIRFIGLQPNLLLKLEYRDAIHERLIFKE